MTTVVQALNRAALMCRVKQPSSWVNATREDHVSLRDGFMLETVDDVLERVDLPNPIGVQTTIVGTGAETYFLPSNFKRLHRDQLAVYDPLLDRPCVPISTDGEWTYQKDLGTAGTIRYFRVTGYEGAWEISFYDAPSGAIEVHYQTDNWLTNGGTASSAFTAEEDVLLVPRRVLEMGIVWRFRRDKGLPYEDVRMEYEALIARMSNDRRTRRILRENTGGNVPWQDLVPAFIPGS